jgi:hypothetical protein
MFNVGWERLAELMLKTKWGILTAVNIVSSVSVQAEQGTKLCVQLGQEEVSGRVVLALENINRVL